MISLLFRNSVISLASTSSSMLASTESSCRTSVLSVLEAGGGVGGESSAGLAEAGQSPTESVRHVGVVVGKKTSKILKQRSQIFDNYLKAL
jgi:hypothetical protein